MSSVIEMDKNKVEVLDGGPTLPIIFHPNPFSSTLQRAVALEGQSISDIIGKANLPSDYEPYLRVWINDREIARADWATTYVVHGQHLYVRVVPQKSGKDIFRFIAMLAVVIVAAYFAPQLAPQLLSSLGVAATASATAAAVAGITAVISVVGFLAINALIPPPGLNRGSQDDPKYQLTGTNNQFAPYGNIPRLFGKRRLYPVLAARPYSEVQGDDEYLRMVLCVGWGPVKIENIKIGETPITAFEGVEIETREGWSTDADLTLFSRTVIEENISVELQPYTGYNTGGYGYYGDFYSFDPDTNIYGPRATTTSIDWVTRTTDTNAAEFSVDLAFPSGLFFFNNKGEKKEATVIVQAQYRPVGGSTWTNAVWENSYDTAFATAGQITAKAADSSAVRLSGRVVFPSVGQYEVRLRRTTGNSGDKYIDACYWTALRTIKTDYPVLQKNVALIALRMKASNQLNGVPNAINCEATSYLPVYNGSTWSYQLTSNPAWAFADLLRRRGGEQFLTDDRIDLTAIKAWADACDVTAPNASEPRWSFNSVLEGGSIFDNLRLICSNSRSFPAVRDGKHSVVRDVQQTVPIQHITPRNSFGYTGTKAFIDYPHALRVQFPNAQKGWELDERIVFYDGYTAANSTKFEVLELVGCTSATQAFREARYHMAVARLRPEEHVVQMDIEALRCTVGDLVRFSHDAISIGISACRVKSVAYSGSNVSSITLDEDIYLEAGKAYALRVRRSDGSSSQFGITNPGTGYISTVTPFTTLTALNGPDAGDLVMFGESTIESAPMIVKKIEPGDDFSATLHLIDAADGVHTADTGTIPAFSSYVNSRQDLPLVYISAVRSDDSAILVAADGTLTYRILVQIQQPSSSLERIDFFEVQYRIKNTTQWQTFTIEKINAFGFITDVQVGDIYELRSRGVSSDGRTTDWSSAIEHTVLGKLGAPNQPTAFTATAISGGVDLAWTNPTNDDFWQVEVYENSVATVGTATKIAETSSNKYSRLGLSASDGVRYYWLKSFNTSGASAAAVGPVSATALNRALVATLSNEAVSLSTNAIGTVASFATAEGQLTIYDGPTDVLAASTLSDAAVGCTGTINTAANNPVTGKPKGYYRVTTMSADTATLTITATYNGQSVDKVFSLSKAKAGTDGTNATSPSLLTLSNNAQTFTYDGAGAASPSSQTITFTADLQNLSGTASFSAQAYNSGGAALGAIVLGGTGNTRTMTNAQFVAPGATAYAVVTASLSGYSDTVTLVKLQSGTNGVNGTDALVGFLTNEAATLAADSAGAVTDFTGAGGTFKVFQGLTDRTTASTFSVAASSGCTVTINASTGVYSVSAMSADTANATLQAVYGGATIQKVLSLSKARAGTNGGPGAAGASALSAYLTNEAVQVFAYADGSVVSYGPATGSFRVFSGTSDISASFSLSTVSNPQALTVAYSTQTYTISGGFDTAEDTATLTIRATGSGAYAGIVLDKVFTLSKAKGGYEIVAALPTTNLFNGRVVYLTTNSKIYRYSTSPTAGWTVEVDGADIKAGSITAAKIGVTELSAIVANVGTLTAGIIRNTSDTYRIDVTNGRTIVQTGGYMKVTGSPFGSSSQFIEWYGPYQASLTSCTEANATYYLKTSGAAYFGGTLSSGILKNSAQTSNTSQTAEIVVGPFSTNGGSKSISMSYSYHRTYKCNSSTGAITGTGSATIVLERSLDNGVGWTTIGTLISSETQREVFVDGEPGIQDQVFYSRGGSITVTDNSAASTSMMLRGRITSITFPALSGTSITQQVITQNISVLSTE